MLHELNGALFSNPEIGVLFFHGKLNAEQLLDWAPSGFPGIAESEGPIRGVLARVRGADCIVVPGVGSFVAAGPMVNATWETEGVFAATTIANELIRLGVPPEAAARFERRIMTDGDILISFRSESPVEILAATKILTDLKATDICTSGEYPPPDALSVAHGEEFPVASV